MFSSGFYWYALGAISASSSFVIDSQYTAIDAVHAAVLFLFGLLAMLASLKLSFPAATIVALVALFICSTGLTVELILLMSVYSCSSLQRALSLSGRYFSTVQLIFCSSFPVGSWFAFCALLIPLCASWIALLGLFFAFVFWVRVDEFYFVYDK